MYGLMDKIRFMRLWDLYGGLLTPNQREVTGLYFNLDLTVSEIAEKKGVSRQGVSECLNLCIKELENFEEQLGHDKMLKESGLLASFISTGAARWAEEFEGAHPEYAAEIAALKEILFKDYDGDIRKAICAAEKKED